MQSLIDMLGQHTCKMEEAKRMPAVEIILCIAVLVRSVLGWAPFTTLSAWITVGITTEIIGASTTPQSILPPPKRLIGPPAVDN